MLIIDQFTESSKIQKKKKNYGTKNIICLKFYLPDVIWLKACVNQPSLVPTAPCNFLEFASFLRLSFDLCFRIFSETRPFDFLRTLNL